jgi:hypothetical protein
MNISREKIMGMRLENHWCMPSGQPDKGDISGVSTCWEVTRKPSESFALLQKRARRASKAHESKHFGDNPDYLGHVLLIQVDGIWTDNFDDPDDLF